jgi:hypothetical protein
MPKRLQNKTPMSGPRYREIILLLGFNNPRQAAKFLGISARQSQAYAAGSKTIPLTVEYFLAVLLAQAATYDQAFDALVTAAKAEAALLAAGLQDHSPCPNP